ncbi:MAG TPA: hypothetical protein VK623_09140 [Flavobacterium sp.]|nr:hypothetical protein [Flavobacterium sp.]
MNTPRSIGYSTYLALIKQSPKIAKLGIVFTAISVFVLIPAVVLISAAATEKYEKYDYAKIKSEGTSVVAKITDIETNYNTTINGVHPSIISYSYSHNGAESDDKFATLAPDKVSHMAVGDNLDVKVLGTESVITTLKPYRFPFFMFLMIPLPFLVLGLCGLTYMIIRIKKIIKLYQYGNVKEAKLVSLMLQSGSPVANFGQRIMAYYTYTTHSGKTVFGESVTNDFMLLNEKKQGDMIDIFVSDDETQSCLVPKLEALKNDWKI